MRKKILYLLQVKEIKKDLIKLSEPISKLMESWDKLSLTSDVFPESEITQDGAVRNQTV